MKTTVAVEVTFDTVPDHEYLIQIVDGGNVLQEQTVDETALSYGALPMTFVVPMSPAGTQLLDVRVAAIRTFDGAQGAWASTPITIPQFSEPAPEAPTGLTVTVT